MPYIRQEQRPAIDSLVEQLVPLLKEPGQMNYAISRMMKLVADRNGHCYDCYNALLGVLDAVGKEFYRRVVGPYEDRKIEQNGDVYGREEQVNDIYLNAEVLKGIEYMQRS